jgi:hypothetical protein
MDGSGSLRLKGKYAHRIFHLLLFLFAFHLTHAQETTSEFWPEMDLWYRFAPSWRLSMYLPFSRNLETQYREGNMVFQADYAWGNFRIIQDRRLIDENRSQQMKACLTRGGFLRAKSLGDNGEAYKENMLFFEEHFRTPVKKYVLLSHRLRSDLRWIGEDGEFSYRVRYRFMVEREWQIHKVSLVPYVNIEPYYDSRYETVNRVRYIGGTSVSWNPRVAIESNITYQHDSRSSVTNLWALNIILHVFFESGKAKPKPD